MTERNSDQGGKSLEDLRGEISEITAQMLGLLSRRTEIAVLIGQAKRDEGRTQVRDLGREAQVLDGMVATNEALEGPVTEAQVRRFGQTLIDIACDAQVADSGLEMGATAEGELPMAAPERGV